jgi:hypothetical protein
MQKCKKMDELDMSWVDNLQTSYIVDISPPQQINIHFIYININNEIIHSFTTPHKLEQVTEDETCIYKEQILKIIELNKTAICDKIQPTQLYRLNEILEYTINLKNNNFTNTITKTPTEVLHPFSLKKINYINDIKFKPSIVDFHPINSLYIIYIENDSFQRVLKPKLNLFTVKDVHPSLPTPTPSHAPTIIKKTKKVKFNDLEKPLKLNTTKKKT